MTSGIWGLFVSAFVSSTVAPGGSEAVLAYMVASGEYQLELIVVIAAVGNTLGALTTWLLGWLASTRFPLDTLLKRKQQKAINTVRKWGIWTLFFSWLPVIGDGLCFAGGWLKLAFIPACLIIFIGKAIRYMFVAYLFI